MGNFHQLLGISDYKLIRMYVAFFSLVITPHLSELITNIFWDIEPLFMFESICWMNFYGSAVNPYQFPLILMPTATSATTTLAPSSALDASSSSSVVSSSIVSSFAMTIIGMLNSSTCPCIINICIGKLLIDSIHIISECRRIGRSHWYYVHLHLYVSFCGN